jgi:hypothetical protein
MSNLDRYQEDLGGLPQLLLKRHVPLVTTPYNRWQFITAIVVGREDGDVQLWAGLLPTPEELEMVASFHDEYLHRWYGDPSRGFLAHQRGKHPFDIDGGANGRYLIKRQNGGWAYRQRSWQYGAEFVPDFDQEPVSLAECLDLHGEVGTEYPSRSWLTWKDTHPETFTR